MRWHIERFKYFIELEFELRDRLFIYLIKKHDFDIRLMEISGAAIYQYLHFILGFEFNPKQPLKFKKAIRAFVEEKYCDENEKQKCQDLLDFVENCYERYLQWQRREKKLDQKEVEAAKLFFEAYTNRFGSHECRELDDLHKKIKKESEYFDYAFELLIEGKFEQFLSGNKEKIKWQDINISKENPNILQEDVQEDANISQTV